MLAITRANGWKALRFYLVPGLLIGAIKLVSALSWFAHDLITNDRFADSVTIFGLGLVGVAVAVVAWPLVVFNVATGAVPLSTALFFPWVNPH